MQRQQNYTARAPDGDRAKIPAAKSYPNGEVARYWPARVTSMPTSRRDSARRAPTPPLHELPKNNHNFRTKRFFSFL